MATFSAYLMWLLATQLRELCPYCLASASLSFGMAALTWSKKIVPDATKATVRVLCLVWVVSASCCAPLVYILSQHGL